MRIGDYAKIGVKTQRQVLVRNTPLSGERFWALITAIDEDGTITARIDQNLVCSDIHHLEDKMLVQFQRKHVLGIYTIEEAKAQREANLAAAKKN